LWKRKNMTIHEQSMERALVALDGLSVGDGFGEQFFFYPKDFEYVTGLIRTRVLPEPIWEWTDDTNMALSIVASLNKFEKMEQDWLALSFANRFSIERGYGQGAARLLREVEKGLPWRERTKALFYGQGSFGNGAAMRVAPLGAYFADDLNLVVEQARLSSEVTHAHPEGIAGGIAIAVAAALAWQKRGQQVVPAEFIEAVRQLTPESEVRNSLAIARDLPFAQDSVVPVQALGNGSEVTAQDTAAFTVWCAAHFLKNYEDAMWYTVSGLGDRDTTCAIVGGIVACYVGREGIPADWLACREPLPNWLLEK
jgi:ADP-ribosylglycohydrolase